VVYRDHGDLDYALVAGEEEVLYCALERSGFSRIKRKDNGVTVFEKDDIEVEIGLGENIIPGYIPWDHRVDDHEYTLR
jgi:hypothetical protein